MRLVNIAPDTTATVRDGKIVVMRRGVVREFSSINEYVDSVALRSGRVPRAVQQALHDMMREARYARVEEEFNKLFTPQRSYWLHPEQLPGRKREEDSNWRSV